MIETFAIWSRVGQAALSMSATAAKAAETTAETPEIIYKRSVMIVDAIRSPLTGNYGELSRMVPEKAAAFSASWSAIANNTLEMQFKWWQELMSALAAMPHDRPPTMIEAESAVVRLARNNVRSLERVANLGSAALAPVARQVKTNVRRLRRPRRARPEL